MTELVRSAAFAASRALSNLAPKPQRSHLSEVSAALLGYGTLAALQVEEADATLAFHLDDAEILVLDVKRGRDRALALLPAHTDQDVGAAVAACAEGLKAAAAPKFVYLGVGDFWDSFAREAMEDAIASSDGVAEGMAGSNAIFTDSAELPGPAPAMEDLWDARQEWSLTAVGTLTGDIDEDRPYTGHVMHCQAKLMFSKAGRAGLISTDFEALGGIDETWREQDRQDEEGTGARWRCATAALRPNVNSP